MSSQRNRVGKEKILEQAEKLFTEQGYQSVSIRSIAEACGVTNAALYYHFDDKSALFAEVMKRHTGNLKELLRLAGEGEKDPQAKITAMAQAYVEQVSNHRPLMFLVRHRAKGLQKKQDQRQLFDMLGDVLEPFEDVFRDAIKNGQVRTFPENYSGASILIGMIHGLNVYCWVRNDEMIGEKDVALLVDFFWNGIKPSQPQMPHV